MTSFSPLLLLCLLARSLLVVRTSLSCPCNRYSPLSKTVRFNVIRLEKLKVTPGLQKKKQFRIF